MLKIQTTKPSKDYELLDSGAGEKLERFGQYILRRPDPQALWSKNLPELDWKKAEATFIRDGRVDNGGKWKRKVNTPDEWRIEFAGINFNIKPTPFKHVGIFPEQEPNWAWIQARILTAQKNRTAPVKVLNLFGYTGGASLAALQAGAEVVQVDGSKSALTWAKANAVASGLENKKFRLIEDDARKFVQREIKRGNKYDAIIMDPPAFGHGAKNEIWKIEEDFTNLLSLCQAILSTEPIFILVNGYASGYSAIAYENCLQTINKNLSATGQKAGEIEVGELTIAESASGRLLPAGIFARWFR